MSDVTWQFYRGIDTIGGTVIELKSGHHRLLFDMGRIFNPAIPVFDAANPARGISDLKVMGIAPPIPGLFNDGTEVPGIETLVAISHSHLDHTGLLPFLRTDVPVLMHEDTYRLLSALDQVLDGPGQPLNYQPQAYGHVTEFGPFRLTLLQVDHDTPGAAAFLIEAPGLKFVYSGDLRLHGAHPNWTVEFGERARDFRPDVLFIEGTRALNEDNSTMPFEHELIEKLCETIPTSEAGVYFSFYPRHPERLTSFIEAAKQTGRRLLVQAPHAYIYETFGGDLSGCAIYGGGSNRWTETTKAWVATHGFTVVSPQELQGREVEYIVNFDYDRFRDWIDIDVAPGGIFIHSNGSPLGPFDPAWDNMLYWLDRLGLRFVSAGSTGHGARGDILSIIDTIAPRVLMPIHSLQPQRIGLPTVNRIMPAYGRVYTASDLEGAKPPTEADMAPVDAVR